MKIVFSRHSLRRIRLYKIPIEEIRNTLEENQFATGKQELVKNIVGLQFPIKIVFSKEETEIVVITAYPLKKAKKNENIL